MKIKETGKNLAISNRRVNNYRLNYLFKIKFASNASLEKECMLEIEYSIMNL